MSEPSTFAHVEARRRCACCRVPCNRCPCKHCGSCSTSGGERCSCGSQGPSYLAGETKEARAVQPGRAGEVSS